MALTVVMAAVVGGSLYVYSWLKNSVPATEGTITIEGVNQDVEITYDKMGVPQIWAKTEHDGYFALGYLHASDRMFQMDMARRLAQGRMSELLGKVTLESDISQRQIGHYRIAQAALSKLNESNKLLLQAYADGVNSYKKVSGAPPFEYLLLGASFKDWSDYDCLALLSFQTWLSDALQNHDLFYLQLREKIGEEKAGSLCGTYPDWAPVTIPEVRKIGQLNNVTSIKNMMSPIQPNELTPYLMSNSSNCWVVAPSKSASGQAILASDPHLPINQLPQFWYMVGLHIKEKNLNVLGISAPGLPFISMGHNGRVAWAFTAGGVDVTDFYSEQINPDDTSEYLTPSGWKKFEYVTDTISASGQNTPIVLTTKLTRHGPILKDTQSAGEKAFHWAGYDADLNLSCSSGFQLPEVDRFEKFQKIVTSLGALNANWLYADKAGNVGYQLGTPIAIRPSNANCAARPGWTDEFEWQGYYPLVKTPHSFNPSQGWLASCNNLSTRATDYPLAGSYAADRILRISELMNGHEQVSSKDCQQFQQDRIDDYLKRWRWETARLLVELGHQELADSINNWNGSTGLDSRETAIILTFLSQLKKMTFADELGDMYSGVRTLWLDEVYENKSDFYWFDDVATAAVESRDTIALRAMAASLEIVGDKTWKDFNSLTMRHPMSGVPLLGGLLDLNRGHWVWPGSAGTLNASHLVAHDDNSFETIVGPSWRFVIDFSDVDGAMFVLPAGNSGNPMSPHFFDFNKMWQEGKYWNIPISEERVKARAVSKLLLKPASNAKSD